MTHVQNHETLHDIHRQQKKKNCQVGTSKLGKKATMIVSRKMKKGGVLTVEEESWSDHGPSYFLKSSTTDQQRGNYIPFFLLLSDILQT